MATSTGDAPLYEPQNPEASRTFQFLHRVNSKYHLALNSYSDLYNWSTTEIDKFWGTVWGETEIIGEKGGHVVDRTTTPAANPTWFSEAKLNWAENMLSCRSTEKIALIQASAPVSFQFRRV
jgi:acetoacetyl-CoA synthetase